MVDTHAQAEHDKYTFIHANMDYTSRTAVPFADHCFKHITKGDKILDVGCGRGQTVARLRELGFQAYGVDITLQGLLPEFNKEWFYESPAWDLPFLDNSFDWVVSTDVLEHIYEDHIHQAIREFKRIAKVGLIHNIALFECHPETYYGYDVHVCVKPLWWWQDSIKSNSLECIITGRTATDNFTEK